MSKAKKEDSNVMDQALKEAPVKVQESFEKKPLKTLQDYIRYNREARKRNHQLRICRYPIKQCPVELHPTDRVVITRNDQSSNPIPAYLSNEYIHFDKKLTPGNTYDLPRIVVDYLSKKATPEYAWFTKADGSKETRISHTNPRFSIRTLYEPAA